MFIFLRWYHFKNTLLPEIRLEEYCTLGNCHFWKCHSHFNYERFTKNNWEYRSLRNTCFWCDRKGGVKDLRNWEEKPGSEITLEWKNFKEFHQFSSWYWLDRGIPSHIPCRSSNCLLVRRNSFSYPPIKWLYYFQDVFYFWFTSALCVTDVVL